MKKTIKPLSGGGLCGSVRYRADHSPERSGYCHCRTCQRSLGGPFGAAIGFGASKAVRFEGAEPTWWRSSEEVRRGFCGRCGSPIAYHRLDTGEFVIWVGTLDDPDAGPPREHYWTGSRTEWGNVHPHLPDITNSLSSYAVARRVTR